MFLKRVTVYLAFLVLHFFLSCNDGSETPPNKNGKYALSIDVSRSSYYGVEIYCWLYWATFPESAKFAEVEPVNGAIIKINNITMIQSPFDPYEYQLPPSSLTFTPGDPVSFIVDIQDDGIFEVDDVLTMPHPITITAPPITTPPNGAIIDFSAINRVEWTNPNPPHTEILLQYIGKHRNSGVSLSHPDIFYDIPANTLANGDDIITLSAINQEPILDSMFLSNSRYGCSNSTERDVIDVVVP